MFLIPIDSAPQAVDAQLVAVHQPAGMVLREFRPALLIAALNGALTSMMISACGGDVSKGTSGRPHTDSGRSVPFRVVDKTSTSYRPTHEAALIAVKDAKAWQGLWREHTAGIMPPPALPAVDFSTHMVLAFFDVASTNDITITGVTADAAGVRAAIRRDDARDCPGLTVIQHHAELITTQQLPGKVSFTVSTVPAPCHR